MSVSWTSCECTMSVPWVYHGRPWAYPDRTVSVPCRPVNAPRANPQCVRLQVPALHRGPRHRVPAAVFRMIVQVNKLQRNTIMAVNVHCNLLSQWCWYGKGKGKGFCLHDLKGYGEVDAKLHSLVISVLDGGVLSASHSSVKKLPVATCWGLKSKGPAGGSNYKALGIQPAGWLLCCTVRGSSFESLQ